MKDLSEKIEKIILQHGERGMDRLQRHLKPGYCRRAAQMIMDNKGVVIIGTGFPVSGSFESDGPISAISLYRVLAHLDYEPVFACAPPISKILSTGYATYELPLLGWDESRPIIKKALAELNPSLIVSIERPGVTADGRYYNMQGDDITEFTAKFDLFFQESQCPCIAFGDGGNEIGMGNALQALSKFDITPSVTTCDELVIASVSNWGVYGVMASLCDLLSKDLFELIDPESTANYLMANGCIDGVTKRREASEDGFPIEISNSIIQQLRSLIIKGKNMAEIKVEKKPAEEQLKERGVFEWPIWSKEVSKFPWSYDDSETCYFLEGDVIVTPENGDPVVMGKGDLVTFPKGMSCTWEIRKDVKKHYVFGK